MIRDVWGKALLTTCLAAMIAGCFHRDNQEDKERVALFQAMLRLAEQGSSEAQYHVGMMYNNGSGVGKDPARAFEWFSKAAAAGDPLGAFKVGCYLDGQGIGVVAQDPRKALEQKLIAARAGYSLAQVDVGNASYQEGNPAEAIKWWKLAADQGSALGLFSMSVANAKGEVGTPDPVLAYAYFKLAKLVSEGKVNPQAQASLDQMATRMAPPERARAEQIVAEWKPQPTALTVKALRGIEDARRVANVTQQ